MDWGKFVIDSAKVIGNVGKFIYHEMVAQTEEQVKRAAEIQSNKAKYRNHSNEELMDILKTKNYFLDAKDAEKKAAALLLYERGVLIKQKKEE